MNVTLHIDGGSRGNPGPAAAGIVITDPDTKQPLHEAAYFLGTATNNVAEYTGLLRGLEAALRLGAKNIEIRSDSELMVRQIHGQYKVKSADLKPLYQDAVALLGRFEGWGLIHVRREKNKRADELVNKALDARADVEIRS